MTGIVSSVEAEVNTPQTAICLGESVQLSAIKRIMLAAAFRD